MPVSVDEYPLARERVRYVGDPVAAVIARDEQTAVEALGLIEVKYRVLTVIENPEEGLVRRESEREAAGFVEQFLTSLNEAVRGKVKQYNRIIGVLWYCYLSPDHATQLEVAAILGVSDSLVSDYRRRIEQELRALAFSEVEEAKQFELALRAHVKTLVFQLEEREVVI